MAASSDRRAQLETAGTFFWLLMDLFWMLGRVTLATAAGMATLAMQIMVFRLIPRTLAEGSANGAVACWIVMNLFWMLGEEYERPAFIYVGVIAVAASFLLLGLAIWSGGLRGPILQRFRRFRFWRG